MKSSGISYPQELDWLFAAQWAHYRIEEFEALSNERKAVVIAMFRTSRQIEAVQNEDRDIRMEQERLRIQAQNQGWH